MGGYDESLLKKDTKIQWHPWIKTTHYKINLKAFFVGGHKLDSAPRVGFLDSGTTFAYASSNLFSQFERAFMGVCKSNPNNCHGKAVGKICYEYQADENNTLKKFYKSYPVLSIMTTQNTFIKWYPSEYFYRNLDKGNNYTYCIAIDIAGGDYEFMMGGSFLRQKMFVFDHDKERIGVATATCSDDPNQILDDSELNPSCKYS